MQPHLALVFGPRAALESSRWFEDIRRTHPGTHVAACSTAGEILGDDVGDLGIVATLVQFEQTRVRLVRVNVREFSDSETAGSVLARSIDPAGLAHVIVLSDGQLVNGSHLVRGLTKALPSHVGVTGGLAGDGSKFERTYVCADGPPIQGNVAAVCLYGKALHVSYGSMGGWEAFGQSLRVTRARGNVLEQLDGRPALAVYGSLLGDKVDGLPATGLLFPLLITTPDGRSFVRTLLNIDATNGTLTFAGDVPVGARVQLMRADFEKLVAGARGAAEQTLEKDAQLALLVSCVGRRLVLGEQTKAEVAAVRQVIGRETPVIGFYSYGEICPTATHANCELHNQTMTITTLREA